MNIDKACELEAMLHNVQPSISQPFKIGGTYLFRLVTNYWTGRVVSVGEHEIVIEDAAWIADTGRFHDALITGSLNEVEPVDGLVIIGRGALVDTTEWRHALPRDQK